MSTCPNDNPDNIPWVYGGTICPYQNYSDSACPAGYQGTDMLPAVVDNIPFCFGDFVQKVQRIAKKCVKVLDTTTESQKYACCNGLVEASECAPGYCRNSVQCDNFMTNYCQSHPEDPRCGCLMDSSHYKETAVFGPVECVDTRCTRNPQAYKRRDQQNTNCKIVNCSINGLSINANNSSIKNLESLQQCGNDNKENNSQEKTENKKYYKYIAILVFIILLFIIFI
jgi:hypothetical protein